VKTASLIQTIRKKLTSATESAVTEITELRRRIDETRAELEHARGAAVPVEKIVEARIPQAVREAAEEWRARYGSSLIHGPGRLGDPGLNGRVKLLWSWHEPISFGALAAADPAYAGDLLLALVRGTEYRPGAPSAERPALIARLEAELAELEETEERLIDEAAAAGVSIAHRAEVITRRQEEQLERDREERRIADRKRRQEAVDARHARRARGGRSKYLESGGKLAS